MRSQLYPKPNFKMRIRNLSLSLISTFISLSCFAQSIYKNSPSNDLNAFYNQHIGKAALLFSGPSYVTQTYPMQGSPFLASDTLTLGWISYDGHYYNNILLQWDILQNYVLTKSLAGYDKMILRTELIDSFSFAGHLVKFIPRNLDHNLMNEGLYEVLYAGATSLIARRRKESKERIDDKKVIYEMIDKSRYYINKKGIYYQVSNKKDLAALLTKDMPEIKKAVRKNKLKWRKNLEQVLILAVVHSDKANTLK